LFLFIYMYHKFLSYSYIKTSSTTSNNNDDDKIKKFESEIKNEKKY